METSNGQGNKYIQKIIAEKERCYKVNKSGHRVGCREEGALAGVVREGVSVVGIARSNIAACVWTEVVGKGSLKVRGPELRMDC